LIFKLNFILKLSWFFMIVQLSQFTLSCPLKSETLTAATLLERQSLLDQTVPPFLHIGVLNAPSSVEGINGIGWPYDFGCCRSLGYCGYNYLEIVASNSEVRASAVLLLDCRLDGQGFDSPRGVTFFSSPLRPDRL
jgi:hypothetical protein